MRIRRKGFCYPGYRYCGPGCNGQGAPVNEVDRCCQLHDECYKRYGASKYCDEKFQKCLNRYTNYPNKMGKDARLFSTVIRFRNAFK